MPKKVKPVPDGYHTATPTSLCKTLPPPSTSTSEPLALKNFAGCSAPVAKSCMRKSPSAIPTLC